MVFAAFFSSSSNSAGFALICMHHQQAVETTGTRIKHRSCRRCSSCQRGAPRHHGDDDGVGGGNGGKGMLGWPGGGADTLSACIMSVPSCTSNKRVMM